MCSTRRPNATRWWMQWERSCGVRKRRRSQPMTLFHLHDHFDFDDRAEWQRSDADCGAGVAAAIAEQSDKQVGATVDHLRLRLEIVGRVHEASYAYDPFHFAQVADFFLQRRQQRERSGGGGA